MKRWTQYPINYSVVKITDICKFLEKYNLRSTDLLVVHKDHIEEISREYKEMKVLSPEGLDVFTKSLREITSCFWLTDRVDSQSSFVRKLINYKIPYYPIELSGPARVWFHNPLMEQVMIEEFERQSSEKIAKFDHGIGLDFGNLIQFIEQSAGLDGDFIEIGCYFGSSSCTMVNYMDKVGINKIFRFYDTFDGFNYTEARKSLDNSWRDTHKTDGIKAVRARIKSRTNSPQNIFVYKRNIIKPNALKECESIALANIDVDLYEAVLHSLIAVDEKIVKNGIIIVEDPGHTPRLVGANAAFETFLDMVGRDKYVNLFFESGQKILIKK